MRKILHILPAVLSVFLCVNLSAVNLKSVYSCRPDDPGALYFTPEEFGFKADGKTDVSEALQEAIYRVKREKNFGILFIPEGKYRISRTIYIPKAVRVIGYGKNRPEFILSRNSPGFDRDVETDKGKSAYMFWFTDGIVEDASRVSDANAGTFYSAMSNVNVRIEDGNPAAVAFRTHYAQHSFISHIAMYIGGGKAGVFDVGNEMEDLAFYGGQYGIISTKASPGWQVMMVDAYFEGQRKAAFRTAETGLAIVNLHVKNVPCVFDIDDNYWEKIYIQDSRFENVSDAALRIAVENNSYNSISLRNVVCSKVPVLAFYKRTGEKTSIEQKNYIVRSFDHGLRMDSLDDLPQYRTTLDAEAVSKLPEPAATTLPAIPDMSLWANVRDYGAVGDGVTDDTEAIRKAIAENDAVYFPTGWYRVSGTVGMRPETRLIGLHPFATQLMIADGTPAFSGFGTPVPVVESSKGGDNILAGIGINTSANNYRAVGVKWMAGGGSYLNDVKFVGGHGGMEKPDPSRAARPRRWNAGPRVSTADSPIREQGMDIAWDRQCWSLWVTEGGGGTFKDVWTANTYATAGFYAENTSTPGRIYAMSIEHHVRNEVRFKNVSNWEVYCMQTEEETVESSECQPIEMDGCSDIRFANLYMFRVIKVNRPYHSAVRLRGCRDIEFLNVHNYSQTKYTADVTVYDQNKGIEVRPWEFSGLYVTGDEASRFTPSSEGSYKLAEDFEFAEGIARDSRGNIYFCEHRMPRLWAWSEERGLRLVADFHWKPYNVAVDTEDNVLVTFRYDRQAGWDDDPVDVSLLPDAGGTSFSGWGNSGYAVLVYAIDPENPETSLRLLETKAMGSVADVAKALYPSNRWRDFHDYNQVAVAVPGQCFVAPDGKTIIPRVYDLARSSALLEAYPGKPFHMVNEYDRRTVVCDVAADGTLSGLRYFVEDGEFSLAEDESGRLYIADGDINVYDADGRHLKTVKTVERPSTLTYYGGKLYMTGRHSLQCIDVR